MNAISAIEHALPFAPFEAARYAVAAWRGRCLEAFARTEAAVSETLLVLAAVDKRGRSLKLPHLVGQRYDALSNAIGDGGPFAEEGKSAATYLTKFQTHNAFRTQIAHGVFHVTLDHRGQWTVVARVLALRAGQPKRDVLVANRAEAFELTETLEMDGRRLGSALGQLRRHFR